TEDLSVPNTTDSTSQLAQREERREHLKTAIEYCEFLVECKELGTFQQNERARLLCTNIRSRIEQLTQEIREELIREDSTANQSNDNGNTSLEAQRNKDQRIISRADSVLARE
ncbi:hypothetical protein PENTCL1PPCAC_17215, partial [Pristionchus entomophagus]